MLTLRPLALTCLLLLCALLPACTEDATQESTPAVVLLPGPDQGSADMSQDMAPAVEPVERSCDGDVAGKVYVDTDLNARSFYYQGPDDEDELLVDHRVELISQGESRAILSCGGGEYGFKDVKEGHYVVRAERDEDWFVSSSSQGLRFGDAVQEGRLKVVVFGDSIPAFGPKPWFPTRFKGIVNNLAEVELVNVAVPASTTPRWLPQGNFFTSRLAGELKDADLVVFSLGGNDLYEFANADLSTQDINELQEDFEALVEVVKANIKIIITEIRSRNPDADIVWLLYPNYAKTQQWINLSPEFVPVIEPLLKRTLISIRKDLSHHERFLLWDMYEATKDVELDTFLIDPLHLNEAGHEFYARDLFKLLGGVIVEDGDISAPERNIGFGSSASLK